MNASNTLTIFSAHTRASRQPRIASVHSDAEIPPLMHGNDWTGQDVAGWWCSEKFDGWRAYWTGSKLVSRQGRDYMAPGWFTASLPNSPLDCELWLGRGYGCDDVHKAIAAGEWERLFIVVFDVPGTVAETAIEIIRSLKAGAGMIPASFWKVDNTEAARGFMRTAVERGGEGCMLRMPGSIYRNTRTDDLLKMKP